MHETFSLGTCQQNSVIRNSICPKSIAFLPVLQKRFFLEVFATPRVYCKDNQMLGNNLALVTNSKIIKKKMTICRVWFFFLLPSQMLINNSAFQIQGSENKPLFLVLVYALTLQIRKLSKLAGFRWNSATMTTGKHYWITMTKSFRQLLLLQKKRDLANQSLAQVEKLKWHICFFFLH